MAGDIWAPLVGRFVDLHYGSLFGRVRLHVVGQHLRAHLPPPPATLADVGGGAGDQSIPLARDGYHLTIVDPSPAMLARAEERLAAEPAEVAARVRLVRASATGARASLGGARYAGVLCHGVIMYIDEPAPFIAALADLAEPGGTVSIVAKNARVLPTSFASEGKWAEALAAFGTDRQINSLGLPTRGDTVEGLTSLLAASGVEQVAWYGVRTFTEGWTRSRPARDPDDLVLAVELEASRRDPYRAASRLFHLVGRRR